MKPSAKSRPEISTDQFRLLREGEKYFLSFKSSKGLQRVPIRDEWLVPPAEAAEEEPIVSSFIYSERVTSFPIGEGELGLQFSSYDIQTAGDGWAAAGRDVFLTFNPANQFLRPGLVDLSITKARSHDDGCFRALMNHFLIADANDDGFMDIGVVREEIRCPEGDDRLTGHVYVQHSLHWYVFGIGGWKSSPGGFLLPDDYAELPLVDMYTTPVDFLGRFLWDSYDPAKWKGPPAFMPSYRKKLILAERFKAQSNPRESSKGEGRGKWPQPENSPVQPNP